jgi:hypothetical protein
MSDAISKAISMLESLKYIHDQSPIGVGGTINAQDYHSVIDALQALQQSGEPVAVRYGFDGYGYLYLDGGSGSDWMTRIPDAEKLYAAPQLEATKPVAYWNKDFTFASFIKLADHIEGEPPSGWVPLYTTQQPVVDVNQKLVEDKYEKLEPALEALVDLCNNLNIGTYDEVIAAEAALERLYLARKALLSAGKGGGQP